MDKRDKIIYVLKDWINSQWGIMQFGHCADAILALESVQEPPSASSGYEGFCDKCNKVIKMNMQGDEIGHHDCEPVKEIWNIDFDGNVKAVIVLVNGTLKVNLAVNWYGDSIELDKIIITKP